MTYIPTHLSKPVGTSHTLSSAHEPHSDKLVTLAVDDKTTPFISILAPPISTSHIQTAPNEKGVPTFGDTPLDSKFIVTNGMSSVSGSVGPLKTDTM